MTETSEQPLPSAKHSVRDLAGAEPPPDLVPEITDMTVMEMTAEVVAVATPFLVTNWLVAEGER